MGLSLDVTDLHRTLSVACGAWFLPHTWSKISARGARLREITGFFGAAGLRPPGALVAVAAAVECLCAVGLILNLYTLQAALLGGLYLLVATLAVLRVSKGKWIWFGRGAEYPAFWAIICLIVAASA